MKIELNKDFDKKVYLDFREGFAGGVDFGKKITRDHPEITKENHSEYIDNYYLTYAKDLEEMRIETEKCFADIKRVLFVELEKYFGHDYSQDNYVCYLSIFDCNPRYIDKKIFQVYYKRPYHLRKEVIAHELTHFAFYDFCFSFGIEDNQDLWELSEIFNVIFLNLPPIQKVLGVEELLFYPTLKDKLEKIILIWNANPEAKKFIETALHYLSTLNK